MVGRLFAVGLAVALSGCGVSARDYGKQLLDDPSVSVDPENALRCNNCHEITATTQHLRSGYTLYDVVSRPTWWGGFEITLLDSVNQCVTNFMHGNPLSTTDDKGRAILVFLQSISPDPTSPALPVTIVENIVDVPSGDPQVGKQLYNDGCGNCHGAPHTGAGRISDKASIVPDDSILNHGIDPTTGARPVLIEKVRHGKFFGVGGNMAPYPLETLSDVQLGAILGYLEQFNLPKSP